MRSSIGRVESRYGVWDICVRSLARGPGDIGVLSSSEVNISHEGDDSIIM